MILAWMMLNMFYECVIYQTDENTKSPIIDIILLFIDIIIGLVIPCVYETVFTVIVLAIIDFLLSVTIGLSLALKHIVNQTHTSIQFTQKESFTA